MHIINLTPHAIVIEKSDGTQVSIPATTPSARIQQQNVISADIDGIPVSAVIYGDVEYLPDPQPETVYVVSAMVAQQCRGRVDVVAPDTGSTAIRDEAGRIVAVRGFVRY
jgi:hypothetical protein